MYRSIMRDTSNRSTALLTDHGAVELVGDSDGVDGFLDGADDEPGRAVVDEFGHRSTPVGDHWGAAGHRLDHAVTERFVEVDQVEQGVSAG